MEMFLLKIYNTHLLLFGALNRSTHIQAAIFIEFWVNANLARDDWGDTSLLGSVHTLPMRDTRNLEK